MSESSSKTIDIAPQEKEYSMEDLLQLLESTAYMLRGMTLDPSIPEHAKEAMRHRIELLEGTVEKCLEEPQ